MKNVYEWKGTINNLLMEYVFFFLKKINELFVSRKGLNKKKKD